MIEYQEKKGRRTGEKRIGQKEGTDRIAGKEKCRKGGGERTGQKDARGQEKGKVKGGIVNCVMGKG